MQSSAFLSKLYEIKPFKIVDSPQAPKTCPDIQAPNRIVFQPQLQSMPLISSLQFQSSAYQQSNSICLNPIFQKSQDMNTKTLNMSTPNKNHVVYLQSQSNNQTQKSQNSQKKAVRKYSNQEASSPHRITLSKKANSINNKQPSLVSPLKTPNKENFVHPATMIQSHLYTNLSSSIDTLFSKIQKIKQEFDCPLSGLKKNQGTQQQRNNFGLKSINRQISLQENKSIGYSPILKPSVSNQISSLSSLSPLLKPQTTYQKNLEHIQKLYNPHLLQGTSFQKSQNEIQPFILPATHNNITQINNKTKSIIDQINMLLDSSKKNYQGKATVEGKAVAKDKGVYMPRLRKLMKYHTCCEVQGEAGGADDGNLGQDVIAKAQDFDEFDDEFTMIKLKATQSENAQRLFLPKLGQNQQKQRKNSNICQTVLEQNGSLQNKQNNNYLNLSYKLQQPLYTEPCISSTTSNNKEIAHQITVTNNYSYNYNYKNNSKNKQIGIKATNINMISQITGFGQLSMRQFQLGKCVGSGKFGDVHICKHKPTGFIFALKKIFKSTIKEYNMIQQFTQQLRIHYSLSNHPHITKLYTHFSDQYHIFLLLEYIEDGTLLPLQPLAQPVLSRLTNQLLSTIEYLHRNSIVHRDIKPQNILISNGMIKLCDFGWSSRCQNQMRRTFCGTLDYVSPEMKDKGVYNQSVDLWSVGVLVFEMLTGFPPYKKQIQKWRGMGGNIRQKWNWDILYPPQISQMAQKFIQKLLKQNPEQRISIRECKQQQFITRYNNRIEISKELQDEIQKVLN